MDSSWYGTRLGTALCRAEAGAVAALAGGQPCDRGLQVRDLFPVDLLSLVRVRAGFTVLVGRGTEGGRRPEGCRGRLCELPVRSRSLDLLILSHVLESCPDPVLALREAYRVLDFEGRLVVTVFNRTSLRRLWSRVERENAWAQPWAGPIQLRRTLLQAGFEPEPVQYLPLEAPNDLPGRVLGLLERCLPFTSASCLLTARKRSAGVTPLFGRSRVRAGVPGGVPEATARSAVVNG